MRGFGNIRLVPGGGICFSSKDGERTAQYMFQPDHLDTEIDAEDRRGIAISYFDRKRPGSFHEDDDMTLEPFEYQNQIRRACGGELRAFPCKEDDDLVVDFHFWGIDIWNLTTERSVASLVFDSSEINDRSTSSKACLCYGLDDTAARVFVSEWSEVEKALAEIGIEIRIDTPLPIPSVSIGRGM